MKVSLHLFKVSALLLIGLALAIVVSCKPEGNRVLDPRAGALVSPVQTPSPAATAWVSPIQTPVPSVTPISVTPTRSPWPITPEPSATATPPSDPLAVYDPVNRFRLRILPGWYAITPDANAVGGVTSISNYDKHLVDEPPTGSMSIEIYTEVLGSGQSFEQWLSDQRARGTSPEYGAGGVTLTEPQPYTLGRYAGVTYTSRDLFSGEGITIIFLMMSDRRIVIIDLAPADSPMLASAQTILSTLEVSPISPP